jgi:hypothetical protein
VCGQEEADEYEVDGEVGLEFDVLKPGYSFASLSFFVLIGAD